jgi:TPR repeat protein
MGKIVLQARCKFEKIGNTDNLTSMKLKRLIFSLGLALVFVGQTLHAQQKNADGKQLADIRTEAEKGDATAQCCLGARYVKGQGVTQDYVEAVKWFRKAADQNLAEAQYNLGLRYGSGQGVAKDGAEALKWFILSAAQGNEQAKKAVTELEESIMSPEQIAEGKRRVNDWLEQHKKP